MKETKRHENYLVSAESLSLYNLFSAGRVILCLHCYKERIQGFASSVIHKIHTFHKQPANKVGSFTFLTGGIEVKSAVNLLNTGIFTISFSLE